MFDCGRCSPGNTFVDDGYLQGLDEVFFTVGASSLDPAPEITLGAYVSSNSSAAHLLPHVGNTVTYGVKARSPQNHPLSYEWDFEGETAPGQTASRIVESPGRHFAVVTVMDTQTDLRRMDWYMLDTWEWPTPVPEPELLLQLASGLLLLLLLDKCRTHKRRAASGPV
jgi:hypothetical protein